MATTSPSRLVLPIAAGLLLGTGVFGGYLIWTNMKAQHAAEVAPGDPDLARAPPVECAIAEAAMTAAHGSGDDARWQAAGGVKAMTLLGRSQVVNPSDVPGFSDDEAADLRGKAAVDWRGCAGMGALVKGLGWVPVSEEDDEAAVALSRPAMNKAGDEAKVYEAFLVPRAESGLLKISSGPTLLTLHPAAGGAWTVASATPLPHRR